MKTLLLYNVKAGRSTSNRVITNIEALFLKHGYDVHSKRLQFGVNPFDGAEDAELVVICGGDGTINYVVNSMRRKGLNPTLGIIPTGTANDMANALGLPIGVQHAAMRIIEGEVHNVDCGKVNDEYFVNVFSFGMFTTASQRTPRTAKKQFGRLAYLKPGIDDLRHMRPIKVSVRTETGEVFDGSILVFLAFNGISAGRMPLSRNARIDDGMIDVVMLERRDRIVSFNNIWRYILGGNPDAVRHIRCSHIEVTSAQRRITDIDGERGPNFPLVISCEHGSLKIRY